MKLSVTFPNFRGDECEDVHEFILNNFKRAGRLNGWNELVHGLTEPSEWCVRQAINQRRQLEKESFAAVIIHIALECIVRG